MAEEKYIPTLEDKLLYTGLVATNAVGVIQQAYIDGKIADRETYNQMYKATKTVDRLIRALQDETLKNLPLDTFKQLIGPQDEPAQAHEGKSSL